MTLDYIGSFHLDFSGILVNTNVINFSNVIVCRYKLLALEYFYNARFITLAINKRIHTFIQNDLQKFLNAHWHHKQTKKHHLSLYIDDIYCQDVLKLECIRNIWDKVLKNRQSKICGSQPLKNLKNLKNFEYFKGCLPQILHGPFLDTLTHM